MSIDCFLLGEELAQLLEKILAMPKVAKCAYVRDTNAYICNSRPESCCAVPGEANIGADNCNGEICCACLIGSVSQTT